MKSLNRAISVRLTFFVCALGTLVLLLAAAAGSVLLAVDVVTKEIDSHCLSAMALQLKGVGGYAEAIIAANYRIAHGRVVAVDAMVETTLALLLLIAAIAMVFVVWLIIRVRRDVTSPLRTVEAQALARHDPLTGLVNRHVLMSDSRQAIAHAKADGSICLALVIDLDRLQHVNDVCGHAVGDSVLCEVASRLDECIGKRDTVARLDGDEFAVITHAQRQAFGDEAMLLAARLQRRDIKLALNVSPNQLKDLCDASALAQ